MAFDFFGWTSRRAERMRYLRRLPWRQRLWLFGAVACTFSTTGFLSDLTRLTSLRPTEVVIGSALVSGVIACGYLLAAMHGFRWLPVAALGQLVLMSGAGRLAAAFAPAHAIVPTLDLVSSHAILDAAGVMAGVVVGYALFIGFISRQGLHQIRLDTEIALARDIHAHLVPPIARRAGRFDIVGRSMPSSEVGGDLFDVIETDGHLLAIVADVSGHGVQAGTLMAMVRSAVRVRASAPYDLPGIFSSLDDVLIDLGRPDKFVTAAALRFRAGGEIAGGGEAEALLAGHLPILVVRARDRSVERIENLRPPIGLPRPMEAARILYASGDLFAILTDGLTEVSDAAGRLLGMEAIEELLRERSADPLASIADAVFERARAHGPIDDDRTLLLVRALTASD